MEYRIKKGNHYSTPRELDLYTANKEVIFQFSFNETNKYIIPERDQLDVNKLFGFSMGHHHTNSIRIGWNTSSNSREFTLYAYIYENGERFIHELTKVFINREMIITLLPEFKENRIRIKILDCALEKYSIFTFSYKFPKFKWGYMLFPYFGGNQPSPKNMHINLIYGKN